MVVVAGAAATVAPTEAESCGEGAAEGAAAVLPAGAAVAVKAERVEQNGDELKLDAGNGNRAGECATTAAAAPASELGGGAMEPTPSPDASSSGTTRSSTCARPGELANTPASGCGNRGPRTAAVVAAPAPGTAMSWWLFASCKDGVAGRLCWPRRHSGGQGQTVPLGNPAEVQLQPRPRVAGGIRRARVQTQGRQCWCCWRQ